MFFDVKTMKLNRGKMLTEKLLSNPPLLTDLVTITYSH